MPTIKVVVTKTSLGQLLIASSTRGVCAIALGERLEIAGELAARFPGATQVPPDRALRALGARVARAIERGKALPQLRLDLRGTAFQRRVWRALMALPRGTTTTYAELARRIGAPRAARAVGNACGQNPLALVVPCHRVLRGDGSLGGYRWGLERKRALLDRELTAAKRTAARS